jgi:decaprenylphosphoryl-5-phosphoribose phosphatase
MYAERLVAALSTSRWFPAVSGAAALGVGLLTILGRGRRADERLYRSLNRPRGAAADAAFRGITELGSIWASAGAAAALAAQDRPREGLDALGAAAAMWAVGQGAKRVFRRPRPYDALGGVRLLIGRPRGTSWPSSHPAVILAFVTVAARDLGLGPAARAALGGLAAGVGVSRVYLGVHYPADVAGGLLLGRGVADLWSSFVSPRVVGSSPSALPPGTVGR